MTISSATRMSGPFAGSASVSTFPFSFKVFKSADLVVCTEDISGNLATLTLNSDYAVTLNAWQDTNPGGSITLTAGPLATGTTLVITSGMPQLQQTELTNQGGFYPEVITAALDSLTIMVQQLQQEVNRCVKMPVTEMNSAALAPAPQRAGMLLLFDADGNISYMSVAPGSGVPGSQAATCTLDGVNTQFQFVAAAGATPAPVIFAAGVLQTPGVDYGAITYVSGSIWSANFTAPKTQGPITVLMFA